ncbi:MAG: hypothetical protein ACRD8O_11275 [Bryobacteraceae bacterium]
MLKANSAEVTWDPPKKEWQVRIHVGAEVIKRKIAHKNAAAAMADEELLAAATQTAKDEGYELDLASTSIRR